VELLVERDGSSQPILVTLGSVAGDNGPVGRIGAGVEVPEGFFDRYRVVVREGPIEAVGSAIDKTWSMASLMLEMLWKMMVGEASVEKNLGSVISIAKAAGQTAEYGIAPFLKFLAQISIVLAVMNLLPIPMLDGGHLMFYGIEAVRGKPLSSEAQERFDRVGLALLLTLITFALYLDLIRLLG
jgi:regulator of sigma E protease